MGHPNRWVSTDFLRQNPPTKKKFVGDDIGRYFLSDIVGRFFLSVAKSFGGTQALDKQTVTTGASQNCLEEGLRDKLLHITEKLSWAPSLARSIF